MQHTLDQSITVLLLCTFLLFDLFLHLSQSIHLRCSDLFTYLRNAVGKG